MKRLISSLLLFFLLCSYSYSQDIVEVQGFTYASTTRDTVIEFPEGDHNQYEKILMVYSMRCKDGLVSPPISGQTNIGCGEWDYSCNTNIIDSSRVDSLYTKSPSHIISNFSGEIFNYTSEPTYTYYQSVQKEVVYDNVLDEQETSFGGSDMNNSLPLGSGGGRIRTQLLFSADELSGLGLTAGDISGLKLFTLEEAGGYNGLRLRMGHTAENELGNALLSGDGMTEVYFLDSDLPLGEAFFKFHTAFEWDGSSNIVLDISYSGTTLAATAIEGETRTEVSGLFSNGSSDQFFEMHGAGFIDVPHALPSVSDEITVMFWNKGDDVLPVHSTAFEGTDDAGIRQMNVHLPWGNGRVYWDCGNDGSGYDRIDKAAPEEAYKNVWNHWAFTKNASTGEMKIYLNGELWHSGTGLNRPIDVTAFKVGSAMNESRKHFGMIDDFQIWDVALDEETIQNWMSRKLNDTHPMINNLITHFDFDDDEFGIVTDQSNSGFNGMQMGSSIYRQWAEKDLVKNLEAFNFLPHTVFVQGSYESTITEFPLRDSLVNIPNKVDSYVVDGTDLLLDNTDYFYESGQMYVFDEDGMIVDSVEVGAENTIEIMTLVHYRKFPAKFEIMSFVTPYGINLDLGPEGKSWIFDVTDFGPILKGKKRLNMERAGRFQENNDIKFVFVKGTPSRNVLDIHQVWPVTSENYVVIMNDEKFEPRTINLNPEKEALKLRAVVTGHGQEGEFIPRTHLINVQNINIGAQWLNWTECSENPIFPQGGTWIYDRAGWCPGQASDLHEFEVTDIIPVANTIDLDYNVTSGSGDSRYIVNVQLVSYGAPNFSVDAELVDILNPSTKVEHGKYNPMCANPKVVIKNNGSTNLTSLDIIYDVDGNAPKTFTWTGNLEYQSTAEVDLPNLNNAAFSSENSVFNVRVENPNGQQDEYENNNAITTSFDVVPTYGENVVIRMKTNSAFNETSYTVFDSNGDVVFAKNSGLSSNSVFTDTLHNLNGCYRLLIQDSGQDGLSWPWNGDGTGYVQIKTAGELFTAFEPNFGRFISYDFIAGEIVSTSDVDDSRYLNIYPNPGTGLFHVELEGYSKEIQLQLTSVTGQLLMEKNLYGGQNSFIRERFDLTNYEPGVYVIKVLQDDHWESRRIIKL